MKITMRSLFSSLTNYVNEISQFEQTNVDHVDRIYEQIHTTTTLPSFFWSNWFQDLISGSLFC